MNNISFHEIANMNTSQRAMLAAHLDITEQKRRKDWIKAARREFLTGEKDDCCVCGKYKSITHAHHVYPLSTQAAQGLDAAIQDYVWLCPNHHALAHIYISGLLDNVVKTPNGFAPDELDDIQKVLLPFVEIHFGAKKCA